MVPGLLQTEEYARAILSARPDGNLDDLDEQVAARLARQAILDRTGAPQLWCILDEGVLHRAIGGSKVMRSQLYRLAEVAGHPKTRYSAMGVFGSAIGLITPIAPALPAAASAISGSSQSAGAALMAGGSAGGCLVRRIDEEKSTLWRSPPSGTDETPTGPDRENRIPAIASRR